MKAALVNCFERQELFHDLVKEVIEEAGFAEKIIPAVVPRPHAPIDDDFEKMVECEINAFHRLHPTLLEQYPGEIVAIYVNGLSIAMSDKLALYQRIQEQYPGQFVLMRRVEKEPERTNFVFTQHGISSTHHEHLFRLRFNLSRSSIPRRGNSGCCSWDTNQQVSALTALVDTGADATSYSP